MYKGYDQAFYRGITWFNCGSGGLVAQSCLPFATPQAVAPLAPLCDFRTKNTGVALILPPSNLGLHEEPARTHYTCPRRKSWHSTLPPPQLPLPGVETTILLLWKQQESRRESSELGVSVSAATAMPSLPLRLAVVCWSNQNWSMEAHNILGKRGFSIRSFRTGTNVKLPGPACNRPNVYDFRAMYDEMYKDLLRKDKEL